MPIADVPNIHPVLGRAIIIGTGRCGSTLLSDLIAEEPDTSRPVSISSRGRQLETEQKPAGFIPGHRRNMSTPSPDNSPARKPNLESTRALRQPQQIELNSPSPNVPEAGDSTAAAKVGMPEVAVTSGTSSRAESPTKGRVRELAERLDSGPNSRRSSLDGSIKDKITVPVDQ